MVAIKYINVTSKAEAVIEVTDGRSFTEHDFAELALLAADQAGASLEAQTKIKALLDAALDRCQCGSCCPSEGDR
jgi:hypothetical protein